MVQSCSRENSYDGHYLNNADVLKGMKEAIQSFLQLTAAQVQLLCKVFVVVRNVVCITWRFLLIPNRQHVHL
jgi:hypothetical protein